MPERELHFLQKNNIKYCDPGITNALTLKIFVTGTTKVCTNVIVVVRPADYNSRGSTEAVMCLLTTKTLNSRYTLTKRTPR